MSHRLSILRQKSVHGPRIIGFATQGENSGDAERLSVLLSRLPHQVYPFRRHNKARQFFLLLRYLFAQRPDLVVMEGTGVAGGAALLLGRFFLGIRYVVSSGDAVGPYVRRLHPFIGIAFSVYERMLYRYSAGFIGWTPYLVGRALTFGCRRAMTAAGWAPLAKPHQDLYHSRTAIRAQLGIGDDAIVFGLVGSLHWNSKVKFCYGSELIRAMQRVARADIAVLIVGDGNGKQHLEQMGSEEVGRRLFFTGQVPRNRVPDYLAAMDVASLPQSLDGVGSFRYTTKLSEYLAASLPIVSGQLPMTYDLPGDWFWRINGSAPWREDYVAALAAFMQMITHSDINYKQNQIVRSEAMFNKDTQVENVKDFLMDLIDANEVCSVTQIPARGGRNVNTQ